MPYAMMIVEDEGVLRVEAAGVRSFEDSKVFWTRVARECRERHLTRILAVLRLTGRMSRTDLFDMASHPQDLGWDGRFRMAVVDMNEASFRDNKFGTMVAMNRGYAMEIFDSLEAAEEWLAQ